MSLLVHVGSREALTVAGEAVYRTFAHLSLNRMVTVTWVGRASTVLLFSRRGRWGALG